MPFLKFSRDRRGYEHFYVVEAVSGRRGKTRERVLDRFCTPPNVKVGREPFDDHVMHALEAQYPGMRFDWAALRNTPIPAVEPEDRRERRLADRAARRAQGEEEATETAAGDRSTPEQPAADSPRPDVADLAIPDAAPAAASDGSVRAGPGAMNEPGAGDSAGQQQRHRRRRRGQRQRGPVVGNRGREDV